MKTKITVTELSHDDLTNLLSVALYGSTWFGTSYDREIYKNLTNTTGECLEDKLACFLQDIRLQSRIMRLKANLILTDVLDLVSMSQQSMKFACKTL